MRTGKITLAGREYLLTFSTRVLRDVMEHYGSMEAMYASLTDKADANMLSTSVWMLARMIDAGARYAQKNGIPNPEPLTEDDIYDITDINDFAGLRTAISETISNSTATTVAVEPGKNAEATQGQ